ncbi:DNA polymerase IV [Posidoniimonas polymericola]|uniref:DNA polymerase IV n=1 Tax=Posidoniimonas polymericola TaxID=2528002 RepID=A0A5C5XVJ2_9BACT|nr:DNA polymerase Y family protein [Posidoniimonas polymericola]TWT66914.1 DNA polymerase IV [Posidoniimonas polymericola]
MANQQRILAAWLPDWPVQRLRAGQPLRAGRGEPQRAIAVSASSRGVDRVASCCPAARQLGVLPGMRTAEAEAIAGPEKLAVFVSEPKEDLRRLEQLAEDANRFSPIVAIDEATRSALLMDVSGMWPLWGDSPAAGEQRLAAAVAGWLTERCLQSRVAVGSTVGLSFGAACFGEAAVAVVDHERSAEAARRLPVAALRLDEQTLDRLAGFHLRTLDQLLAIPRASLPSRFGPTVNQRLAQLLGETPEPLRPVRPPEELRADWRFESPVANAEVLESIVGLLLARLESRLTASRQGAKHVRIEYLFDTPHESTGRRFAVDLRLSRATCSQQELQALFALRSDGLHFEDAVAEVNAHVVEAVLLQHRQQLLFEDHREAAGFERDLLVNRLAARVGQTRVCRAARRSSHDPLRAYHYLEAIDLPRAAFRLSAAEAERARRLPLLPRQRPLSVRVDCDQDGSPCLVSLAGQQPVTVVWGPERIETGWWRGRPLARDAYWVKLADGRRFWLLLDLGSRRWRLAGDLS